jgi:hypothetical protein
MDETTQTETPATPALTFEDVYAADASSASDPSEQSSLTPPAAGQPGAAPESPQVEDRSPYIPRARFDEVNTRLREAETFKQQYEWAAQVNPQDLAEVVQIAKLSKDDPIAYVQQFIADLQADPKYGAQLRSLAARALSHREAAPAPQPAPVDMTPTSVQLEDGRVVSLYSAEQLAAREQLLLSQVDQKYAPALQTAAELKSERELAVATRQADTFASDFLTEVRALPNFKSVELQIKSDLQQLIAQNQVGDHPAELRDAVRSLYLKHALPTLQRTAQSAQLDSLQRTAAASSGINPGSAAPTSPRRVKSFDDPSLKW